MDTDARSMAETVEHVQIDEEERSRRSAKTVYHHSCVFDPVNK